MANRGKIYVLPREVLQTIINCWRIYWCSYLWP